MFVGHYGVSLAVKRVDAACLQGGHLWLSVSSLGSFVVMYGVAFEKPVRYPWGGIGARLLDQDGSLIFLQQVSGER